MALRCYDNAAQTLKGQNRQRVDRPSTGGRWTPSWSLTGEEVAPSHLAELTQVVHPTGGDRLDLGRYSGSQAA